MGNIFLDNMDQSHVDALAKFKENHKFCDELIKQMSEVFDIRTRYFHESELKASYHLLDASVCNNSCYFMVFNITNNSLQTAFQLEDFSFLHAVKPPAVFDKDKIDEALNDVARDVGLTFTRDYSYDCDGKRVEKSRINVCVTFDRTDKLLNEKIKLLIALMLRKWDVKTKT